MVVIGHSLGGLLAKMTAQRSQSQLWQTVCSRPIDQISGPAEDCRLLQQAFSYDPVPEVRRIIFVATPHRGSPLADGPLGGLGSRLCVRQDRFRHAFETVVARNAMGLFRPEFLEGRVTSIGELTPANPLLIKVNELGLEPSVRTHSIIPNLQDAPGAGTTDGIVPYASSHLDGTDSELLFQGVHACLDHPAVIKEVGRILKEHIGLDHVHPF
jgi:hypothetical protein